MTRDEIESYISALAVQGVHPYTAAPPVYRALWRLGVSVPPPMSCSFLTNVATMTVAWGVPFGLAMWTILAVLKVPIPFGLFVVIVSLGAVFFGLSMGAYLEWKRRSLVVPEWRR